MTNNTLATSTPTSTPTFTSTPDAMDLHPPPRVTLPSVPNGFVPVPAADLRGHRPMRSEMASVPEAVTELHALADRDGLLGIAAPAPEELAARLDAAAQWTAILQDAVAFAAYARSQQGVAWKEALRLMGKMKAPFQLAAEADPTLLGEYPALARLLDASSLVGKRAAATRARKKNSEPGAQGGSP